MKSTLLDYMEDRLEAYNNTLKDSAQVDAMSESMYYELVAARDELLHIVTYARNLPDSTTFTVRL